MTDERDRFTPAHAAPAAEPGPASEGPSPETGAHMAEPSGEPPALGAHAAPPAGADDPGREAETLFSAAPEPDFTREEPAPVGAHAAPAASAPVVAEPPAGAPSRSPFPEVEAVAEVPVEPVFPIDGAALAATADDDPTDPSMPGFLGAHAAPAQVAETSEAAAEPGADGDAAAPAHAAGSVVPAHAAATDPAAATEETAQTPPLADSAGKGTGEAGTPAHAAAGDTAPAEAPEAVLEAVPDPTAPASPEDTAEIDVEAVEAKLDDPGSTQSFAPITDERIDADSTFDAGTTTSLMWGARSDVGCVRSHNEDSYLVQSPLFCVCDGMGGHAAGEVASSIAVETIAKMAPKAADPALLGAAIEAANAAIIEAAVNGLGKPGMGCTATAAYIEGTQLAIAHVGDSRAYLLHEGTLIRVTRDHSYVEELVDAGEITADEARVHPNRSVITRALGSDPLMYADHFQLNIEEGDRLILCSDGLSSMIPDGDIETIATQSSTAQICTDNLVDAALAAGGSDNVTVVVVDVVNDGHLKKERRKRIRNVVIALAALLAVLIIGAAVAFASVVNNVYLGVKDDAVAIYTGVPGSHFGLKLSWLEDETSVQLSDLPEDTRNRLREGIPQESLEDANETVEDYRRQIDAEQNKQVRTAEAIRNSTDAESDGKDADSKKTEEAGKSDKALDRETTDQGGDAR